MKKLTLSIVIPVYNEQDHLKQCLDAISLQTVMPDEVLVVDNNSSDNTVEIAKTYSFVTVVYESKQGVLHARNTGFSAAKSDIIGRIDADTLLPPNWVTQVKELFADASIDAVTGPVFYYDMPLGEYNRHLDHFFRNIMNKRMDQFPFLYGSNCAVRKSVWNVVRPDVCDDKRIHEDLDLAIHMQEAGYEIIYDPSLCGGVSARRYDDNFEDFSRYMKMFVETYKLHGRQGLLPYVAVTAYTTGYIALQPMRLTYDVESGRHSLRHVLKSRKSRGNPNAS